MKCCFCKKDAGKYGHNALPIKKGRCCEVCNETKVIPERLEKLKKQNPVFLIDWSATRDIIEGKKKTSKDILSKMVQMKKEGKPMNFITPLSNLLRAIHVANPETKIKDLQKLIDCVNIDYSLVDFRDEKAVQSEILRIATIASGGKSEKTN